MPEVKKTSASNATRGAVYEMLRARTSAPEGPPSARTDTSGITAAARELSAALHAVEGADEVRAERVRALRKQIANGTYNPDPREVAIKLLERGF